MKFLLLLTMLSCSEHSLSSMSEPVHLTGSDTRSPQILVHQEFLHPNVNPVDIVFILDTSCSMDDDRLNLSNNIQGFFNTLGSYWIDYRVAITNTDAYGARAGKLQTYNNRMWVEPNSNNNEYQLFNQLHYSLNGFRETGIESAALMLTESFDHNSDFFRFQTPLEIILISDENDQSPRATGERLISKIDKYSFENQSQVRFHSVVTQERETSKCPNREYATPGTKYISVTKQTSALNIDICDSDWPLLGHLLSRYHTEKPFEYSLSEHPDESTINVFVKRGNTTYSDLIIEQDYYYDRVRNTIVIYNNKPEQGDILNVEFYNQQYQ